MCSSDLLPASSFATPSYQAGSPSSVGRSRGEVQGVEHCPWQWNLLFSGIYCVAVPSQQTLAALVPAKTSELLTAYKGLLKNTTDNS